MSCGLGRIERACIEAIHHREEACESPPTTFTVACDADGVQPDDGGNRLCSAAQHVAVKRALAGLRRKGLVTSLRDTTRARSIYDGRAQTCCLWMSPGRKDQAAARVDADAGVKLLTTA